jgi:hypothetical protein
MPWPRGQFHSDCLIRDIHHMVNKSDTLAHKPPDMNLCNYSAHGTFRCGVHVNNLHLFFQDLKSNSQRETGKISWWVLLWNILRRCKTFLDDGSQHFETVHWKTVACSSEENELQTLRGWRLRTWWFFCDGYCD